MNKIIMTADEWNEMINGRKILSDGSDYDYKDVSAENYDALMDWAYRTGRKDIIKACPDAYNCPRSFDEFWKNILYVEGQDD